MIDAATCAKFYARPNKFFTSRARPYTEQPPTEVGGFTRVAENSKSTHYAPRVENDESSQIAWSSKTQRSCKAEADRLEAGGFNLVIDSKTEYLSAYFAKNVGIFLKERINSQYEKVVATNLLAANATGVVVPTAE